MTDLDDTTPRSGRRPLTRVALVAFPACMLVAALAQPQLGERAADVYAGAAAAPGRLAVSAGIGVLGVLFWVLGVTGAATWALGRGRRLAATGEVMALLGAMAHMIIVTVYLVLLGLPADQDRPVLVAALDRIAGHVFPVAIPLLVLGSLGLFVLALGLHRAGAAPRATPVLVAAAILSELVPLPGVWGDVVVWSCVTVGLALVAVSPTPGGRARSGAAQGAGESTHSTSAGSASEWLRQV